MIQYSFGEIVVLPFSYTDLRSEKRRPAIVLLDADDGDVLVARITSKKNLSPFEVAIENWDSVGLLVPSFIRVHKLITIEKTLVLKSLGMIDKFDTQNLRETFHRMIP